MRRAEAVAALAGLAISLRHLLRGGGAPTLPLALAGLRLVYASPLEPRLADLSYMNQELAWRAFADLAASIQALRSATATPARPVVARRLTGARAGLATPGALEPNEARSEGTLRGGSSRAEAEPEGRAREDGDLPVGPLRRMASWVVSVIGLSPEVPPAARLPLDACGFCGASPMHSPRSAVCGCVFCYYCLAATCLQEASPACPRCASVPLSVAAPCSPPEDHCCTETG